MEKNDPHNQNKMNDIPGPKVDNPPVSNPAEPAGEQPSPSTAPVPPTASDVQSAPPTKRSNKGLLAIIAVLVLIILAGGGYLAYDKFLAQPATTPSPTPIAQTSPSPSVTPDPTADWKTYTNQGYGFSFKYPPDLVITETSADKIPLLLIDDEAIELKGDRGGPLAPLEISVPENVKYSSTGAAVEAYQDFFSRDDYKLKNLSHPVSGVKMSGSQLIGETKSSFWTIAYLDAPQGIYKLSMIENDIISDEEFDRILSTFEFSLELNDANLGCRANNNYNKVEVLDGFIMFCSPEKMTVQTTQDEESVTYNIKVLGQDSIITITPKAMGGWGGGYETEETRISSQPTDILVFKDENGDLNNLVAVIGDDQVGLLPIAVDMRKTDSSAALDREVFDDLLNSMSFIQ